MKKSIIEELQGNLKWAINTFFSPLASNSAITSAKKLLSILDDGDRAEIKNLYTQLKTDELRFSEKSRFWEWRNNNFKKSIANSIRMLENVAQAVGLTPEIKQEAEELAVRDYYLEQFKKLVGPNLNIDAISSKNNSIYVFADLERSFPNHASQIKRLRLEIESKYPRIFETSIFLKNTEAKLQQQFKKIRGVNLDKLSLHCGYNGVYRFYELRVKGTLPDTVLQFTRLDASFKKRKAQLDALKEQLTEVGKKRTEINAYLEALSSESISINLHNNDSIYKQQIDSYNEKMKPNYKQHCWQYKISFEDYIDLDFNAIKEGAIDKSIEQLDFNAEDKQKILALISEIKAKWTSYGSGPLLTDYKKAFSTAITNLNTQFEQNLTEQRKDARAQLKNYLNKQKDTLNKTASNLEKKISLEQAKVARDQQKENMSIKQFKSESELMDFIDQVDRVAQAEESALIPIENPTTQQGEPPAHNTIP